MLISKKYFFLFSIFFLLSVSCKKNNITPITSTPEDFSFLRGADISYLPEIRAAQFNAKNTAGQTEDMLSTLRYAGANTFRLRIWVNPADGHSGFAEVKQLANEIKSTGAKVWLTVHYSDTWADPGNQTKPSAWSNLPFQQLKDSVYQYTKKIVTEINPDYIQIGNEINNGFLWPDGRYTQLTYMKLLLQEGIRAVRENSSTMKIMIHYAGHQEALAFYNSMNNIDYDIIALSYYPKWHGKSLDSLSNSISILKTTFHKDVIIAETSYPFTFNWNDWTNNVIGSNNEIISTYPATNEGQKNYLMDLKTHLKTNSNAIGFCYWGGEWVSFKGSTATNGSSWENQALWDFTGKALPAIEVFN